MQNVVKNLCNIKNWCYVDELLYLFGNGL